MEKIKNFLLTNLITIVYFCLALFIELLAVCVSSGKFFIYNPLIYFSYLIFTVVIISAFKTQRSRLITAFCFVLFNAIADLVFLVIFAMTSGTVFDFEMLNLAKDGMGVAEKFVINFVYISVTCFTVALFFILFNHFEKDLPKPKPFKYKTLVTCILAVIIFLGQGGFAFIVHADKASQLEHLLYKDASNDYAEQGVFGNFISEIYKNALFEEVELGSKTELKEFIYKETSVPTVKGGTAKGYNLVVILCESFEWFSFINDQVNYPNGHTASEELLRQIYPNLYDFYDNSYAMTNFHSREKTDIAENYSILGNYPTGYYINYNYPNNALPYTVPNMLSTLYGVKSNDFHNGQPNFYNRTDYLINSAGFNSFTACDNMDITDYTLLGERNLDSQMFDACKEEMFPVGERFCSYITTLTMHGQYNKRENLEEYYEIVDETALFSDIDGYENKTMQEMFRNYAVTAMELDKSIGILNDYLKETGLYDNTLVAIFGDHNAYYSDLSAYVKDLTDTDTDRNYNDLFKVPFMIRVGNGENHTQKIDKFTCSADIVPTLYDLLGINYFSNLYYGNSVFSDKISILYSRAYEVFITEKAYFFSLNHILWKDRTADDAYMKAVEQDALSLLDKIEHINRIFYYDFLSGDNFTEFNNKILEINA